MKRIRGAISRWWEGEYVPDTPAIYRHHWTAACARTLLEFYLREWRWIWTTIIVVVLAVATIVFRCK